MRSAKYVKKEYPPQKVIQVDQVEMLTKGQKKFPDLTTYFKGFTSPIGIEVEVENCLTPEKKQIYWNVTEDGSLKVQGVEFVSHPISGHNIDYALAELKAYLETQNCLWSHRTSIHVHTYVGDFSMEKLTAFTALYAVFESLFFSTVDEVRRGNSYCYHLRDLEPNNIKIGTRDMKYCAFNLGTGIENYNTVEFRHMQGTGDFVKIRRWVQMIVKLHRFVKDNKNEDIFRLINELNTNSQYVAITRHVFGNTAILFLDRDLKADLEEGVLWAKVFLLGAK